MANNGCIGFQGRKDQTMRQRVTASLLSAWLGLCLTPASRARAADRSAAEILRELDATSLPGFDKAKAKNNPVYTESVEKGASGVSGGGAGQMSAGHGAHP
jgi:hypothetical protein